MKLHSGKESLVPVRKNGGDRASENNTPYTNLHRPIGIFKYIQGARTPDYQPKPPRLLSVSNPSWVVRTESNVRKEKIRKPEPPRVVRRGRGRVDCHDCGGKWRTNHMGLAMLPKGEWPKWCRSCGGSGLGYCGRCLGTG